MNTTRNIYIIDDDSDDQELLAEALQEIDSTIICHTANNGDDGLRKLFGKLIPMPLMIFLDLNMPRLDGKQTLARLKNNTVTSSIPVIIYSTSSYTRDIEETKQLGADDYCIKDSDFVTLKKTIANLLRKYLG